MLMTLFALMEISYAAQANWSPNTAEVSKLNCEGTSEEPGSPRDLFSLVKNANGKYTASYAKSATSMSKMAILGSDLDCEFAAADSRLFYCRAAAGTISGARISRVAIPVYGFAPQEKISFQIVIVGNSFSSVLGKPFETLNFLFIDNCESSK